MADSKIIQTRGLTFDDVLLLPDYSEVLPHEVGTQTRLTKNISLNIPLLSAAMDTVTGADMAIAIAREGGIGVIHRSDTQDIQAAAVRKVKRAESEMIQDPICLTPTHTLLDAQKIMEENDISGVPIVDSFDAKRLVGIITSRDLRFEENFSLPVSERMIGEERLIKAPLGTSMQEAQAILARYKIEKLPIVDAEGKIVGLITMKDIMRRKQFPYAAKDVQGRLLAAAAIGVGSEGFKRATALIEAGVDVLVLDTAHGHSARVLETLSMIKEKYPSIEVVVGNIATPKAVAALVEAGADAIKVGIGPGSICTTRIIAGIGVPQMTAVMECAKIAKRHGMPVIADGGVRYSGDITKALAAGADTVMVGSILAGSEESPGERVILEGRAYKVYRGMGSEEAMASRSNRERYSQEDTIKPIAEGIEGRVPYKGTTKEIVYQLIGGLKAGMAYCGCRTVAELQERAHFIEVSPSSVIESHPHDVIITREARNYSR